MKIRIMSTEEECREVAGRLRSIVDVLSIDGPYPKRGASRLMCVYVEARLPPLPGEGPLAGAAKGQLAAIGAVLARFDWSARDRQFALEEIERIVAGAQ